MNSMHDRRRNTGRSRGLWEESRWVGGGGGGRKNPAKRLALTRKSSLMLFLSDSAQPSFPPKGKRERKGNEKRRRREAVSGKEWLCSLTGSVQSSGFADRYGNAAYCPPLPTPSTTTTTIDRVAIDVQKDYTHPWAVQSVCLCFEQPGPARPGPVWQTLLRSAANLNKLSN